MANTTESEPLYLATDANGNTAILTRSQKQQAGGRWKTFERMGKAAKKPKAPTPQPAPVKAAVPVAPAKQGSDTE